MCLSEVAQQFNPPKTGIQTGWKLFLLDKQDRLWGYYKLNKLFSIGEWMEDQVDLQIDAIQFRVGELPLRGQTYRTGFHLFATLEAANEANTFLDGIVKQVECDDVVAEGFQTWTGCFAEHTLPVIVARKIKVCA
jgi:hypothetical protein